MRIIVFSDTHGSVSGCIETLENLPVDMIIHAGDMSSDCDEIKNLYPDIPFYAVCGNNDFSAYPYDLVVEASGFKLFVTHGHMYGVKNGLERLAEVGRAKDADLVIFGHTHIPLNCTEHGMRFLNPGSGRWGCRHDPTYGIIEIDGNNLNADIIKYN